MTIETMRRFRRRPLSAGSGITITPYLEQSFIFNMQWCENQQEESDYCPGEYHYT
ncbi:hypothetical protein Ef22C036LT_38530 [Escherichia fergusonii]|nr:hypothetical protein Ef18B006LT_38940 [Escherichia fergusonii]BES29067.1 hypothetical protein Ef22C021LT_38470 [Escherichia fergusonii]BES33646.1 hypothetical protein Ef22C036LT_38530 [Escherichia fergusonii]BES52127.1 hypothetical protein Ef22C065LT_38550 [Escherichia fergusonii]